MPLFGIGGTTVVFLCVLTVLALASKLPGRSVGRYTALATVAYLLALVLLTVDIHV